MDVYTRMSDDDANDYDKLKKTLLTRYNFTADGCRKRFREVKPETEETPEVVRTFWKQSWGLDDLIDLIVKEQFIKACSEELAMYLLERGPKDLIELTTWAQQYPIARISSS